MTNRLADATSPYLLQHAENPVDWWEWSEEAFAEARRRDVPVFLSIGYSACHWCHVMAHESFENEGIAAALNEHFVSIKVDREERPDIDSVYMQATVSLTGHGGWPMSVLLDQDGRPSYAGTYFPPEPRHQMPSFPQLIEAISDTWANRRAEVLAAGERITEALAGRS
ncbi:MAG: thioredoxin domain-containing protein, partial [Actinobacteria bacterium]|nr:thioredoxin domain-containing protein [Actinomycetota bacterium]